MTLEGRGSIDHTGELWTFSYNNLETYTILNFAILFGVEVKIKDKKSNVTCMVNGTCTLP